MDPTDDKFGSSDPRSKSSDFDRKESDLTSINVHSEGGDIVVNGTIDKRSGYFSGVHHQDDRSHNTRNHRSGRSVLAMLAAVLLGITSNIIAAYLQETYQLISDPVRIMLVAGVFALCLFVGFLWSDRSA